MNNPLKLIVFTLDRQYYGLQLQYIAKVLRAVEITPVPKAANFLSGVVNMHGEIIPVIDIRRLMGMPTKSLDLADRFIVINVHSRTMIIAVDDVKSVMDYAMSQVETTQNENHIKTIIKQDNNLIFVLDLEKLLSYNDVHLVEKMAENGSKIS